MASAPSLETSVPGRMTSAAIRPVSPGPAASSSTRSPGASAAARIIASETGIPHSRTRSASRPQAPAAVSQASRLAARCSWGSDELTPRSLSVLRLLGFGRQLTGQLAERLLDLGAHPLAEDGQQRLGG